MLIAHPLFLNLEPETVIWRYFELWKFRSLIEDSALYFRRSDLLTQIDRMEGARTSRTEEFFDQTLFTSKFVKRLKQAGVTSFGTKTQIDERSVSAIRDELRKRARDHYHYILQRNYINCWHINSEENSLMWNQYVPTKFGVAIRSTIAKLRDAMSNTVAEVYFVPVEYVSHNSVPLRTDRIPGGMSQIVFDMLAKKRIGFSGERELRLITDTLPFAEKWAPNLVGSHLDTSINNNIEFTNIKLDVTTLIDAIVLLPQSGPDLRSKLEDILQGTSLYERVTNSALD